MARPAQLATRLLDVLDTRRSRDRLSARSAIPAWLAAIAVVLPLAAAAPRVAEPASNPVSIDTIPRIPVRMTSQTRKPIRIVQIQAADTLEGCSGKTEHGTTSVTEENENLSVFTNLGGCSIRLSATGKFKFNKVLPYIASVGLGVQEQVEGT